MADSVARLYEAVVATRAGRNPSPRTEKLFARGRPFIAKKLAEEGVEVALDAVAGDKAAVVRESADLVYNLVVLWVEAGIRPEDVWAEMQRREQLMGMAEKLPKNGDLKHGSKGGKDGRGKDGRQFAMDLMLAAGSEAIGESREAPPVITPPRRRRG